MGKKTPETVTNNVANLLGRKIEDLTLSERLQYANQWVAFRIYAPPGKVSRDGVEYVDVRVRKIEAVGNSLEECLEQLRGRQLNPAEFEFTILKMPY